MVDSEKVTAVIGMVLEERREIGTFKYDIISALISEAAFVLERIDRIEKARKQLPDELDYWK